MNCRQAQAQFDDLSRNRLPEALALALRQHLEDCTDCRVAQQRSARLQRLLALKRHEHPGPAYFENFTAEFHRRLEAELQPRPSVLQKLIGDWSMEPLRGWRFSLAGAAGSVVALAVLWYAIRPANQTISTSRPEIFPVQPGDTLAFASTPAVLAVPLTIAAPMPSLARELRAGLSPMMAGNPAGSATSLTAIPAVADRSSEPLTTGYVLDRVTVSPASYEVANVHF